jgi:hypothetical protein|tara:strand:- start:342 stop:500 length:159 start_codon:yes stop_codon:yes gene_type:complete
MEKLNEEIEQLIEKYAELSKLYNQHEKYDKCAEYAYRTSELIRVQLLILKMK